MAVFKELVIGKDEKKGELVRKLYRFSEDLKFTLTNLDEDNFSKEFLNLEKTKKEKIATIKHDSEQLTLRFENLSEDTYAELKQSEESIKLLVSKGSVVSTMLSRMELYGEHIDLRTGHFTIDADNLKVDAQGNATFAGAITGGSMKIGTGFAVDSSGYSVIQGDLVCNLLNPKNGTTTAGGTVTVQDDDGYGGCTIKGTLAGSDAYVMYTLRCKRVKETSDARKKTEVKPLAVSIKDFIPVSYRFKKSNIKSMGFIAQELKPEKAGEMMKLEYGQLGAVWAAAIQQNQKRIDVMKEELRKRHVVL